MWVHIIIGALTSYVLTAHIYQEDFAQQYSQWVLALLTRINLLIITNLLIKITLTGCWFLVHVWMMHDYKIIASGYSQAFI